MADEDDPQGAAEREADGLMRQFQAVTDAAGPPGDPLRDALVGGQIADIIEGIPVPPGPPVECGLCGTMSECSPLGEGVLHGPFTAEAKEKGLRLCLGCMRLQLADAPAFWAKMRQKHGLPQAGGPGTQGEGVGG